MDFKSPLASRFLRIVAIVVLLVGLSDAARLLGIASGGMSPIAQFGQVGFASLAAFCIAHLFAAVGLWIKASWGAVLLVIAIVAELVMFFAGLGGIQIGPIGFVIRVVVMSSVAVLLFLSFRVRRAAD